MGFSKRLAGVFLAAALAASCASLDAETPAQWLFAAQAEFNIHQRVAIAYLSQPECGTAAVLGCARPDVKATLKSMAVRVRTSLAAARAALGTAQAHGTVTAAAGLVRDFAAYLARKEITNESTNRSHDPAARRSDRARRGAGAGDQIALRRHQREDQDHGRGGPRSDARRMG